MKSVTAGKKQVHFSRRAILSRELCAASSRMHIVLLEPEIPPNTGNVARLCAATQTVLHLIEPLGFKLDDTQLKRAGMDYWEHVEWHRWHHWTDFWEKVRPGNLWFIESGGPRVYTEVKFAA